MGGFRFRSPSPVRDSSIRRAINAARAYTGEHHMPPPRKWPPITMLPSRVYHETQNPAWSRTGMPYILIPPSAFPLQHTIPGYMSDITLPSEEPETVPSPKYNILDRLLRRAQAPVIPMPDARKGIDPLTYMQQVAPVAAAPSVSSGSGRVSFSDLFNDIGDEEITSGNAEIDLPSGDAEIDLPSGDESERLKRRGNKEERGRRKKSKRRRERSPSPRRSPKRSRRSAHKSHRN